VCHGDCASCSAVARVLSGPEFPRLRIGRLGLAGGFGEAVDALAQLVEPVRDVVALVAHLLR
jgi:hypothetical protein